MKIDFAVDGGVGARAVLGVVVLQTDETLEPEFARMMDIRGVALYHTRIPMSAEVRPDSLARMKNDLPTAVSLLPEADFDVIGYGCTSAAAVIGSDGVREAVQSVRPRAAVTDPLRALAAACAALGVKRLGFASPYIPEVSARMRDELERAGFEIAGFASFSESDDRVVARITEESVMRAAETVFAQAQCDAVVVSCTNLRCLRIAPAIEAKIGAPVISSNMALAWHMQKLAGVTKRREGMGALFAAA